MGTLKTKKKEEVIKREGKKQRTRRRPDKDLTATKTATGREKWTFKREGREERSITCRFRICCSISRAFRGFLPNISNPEVSRSSRWIVRRFFRPNSCTGKRHQTLRTTGLSYLGQDEDNGVVPVPPAWMDLQRDVSREKNVLGLAVHTTARPASSRLRWGGGRVLALAMLGIAL